MTNQESDLEDQLGLKTKWTLNEGLDSSLG